ncbi:MAG: pyrimidine 5'-nucleotidase [Hyphomicrobiales bacterium]|nr:pyrimidine 5'-nucleotidase [Hyphomicrobiales bacterium]
MAFQQNPADPALAQRFSAVESWIFDLDNTLYPPHADLWPKVDQKITAYVSNLLGVDGLTARALQKYYYQAHGTTLNGLMREHAIDPHDFLDFVHDIDRSNLPADARLADAIARLPGRKFVFTNGSRRHAEETTRQLGIDHLFDDVFDIVASRFTPKPARETYERFLATHAIAPAGAAMFEDIPRNLDVPVQLGMRTVLVVPDARGDHKEDWERLAVAAPRPIFDAITADLPRFLDLLAAALPRRPA